jgi:hypothetical protein
VHRIENLSKVGPLLTVVFVLSTHSRTTEPRSCDRAYDVIQHVAQSERKWDYAREVLVEGRAPFVRDCQRYLTPPQVQCLIRAKSSRELYSCT